MPMLTAKPVDVPCLISREQLAKRVGELARQISADYEGKEPIVVGVLKGAFVFMSDLVRQLTIPVRFDFVKISSYGDGTNTSGQITLHLDLSAPVAGQDVLVLEDIVDTGTSCCWLLEHLRHKQPPSIKLCALLDKPSRRQTPLTIDYLGFSIPDRFVVGYGIDFAERYRYLPYVGYLPEEEEKRDGQRKNA
jgi:hypoxanthine phosphoribosyltransferase